MGKIRFHIVHSVKGGCGKTAFSLFKAMELAGRAADESCARVLLLDADFKGSGLKTLIYAKDGGTYNTFKGAKTSATVEKINSIKDKYKNGQKLSQNSLIFREEYQEGNLNDYVSEKCETLSEIITEGAVIAPSDNDDEIGFNGYADFIFCSPKDEDRTLFRYIDGNRPELSVGKFRLRIRKLLKEICFWGADDGEASRKKKDEGRYRDVVMDMPPGYDEYSGIMLEILRKFVRDRKEKDELYYYVVTTGDRSHLDAAREVVKSALEDSAKEERYTKVYAVFNETHVDEYKGDEGGTDGADAVIKSFMEELKEDKSRVEPIICMYQKEYFDFCRDDMRNPFVYKFR